MASKNEHLVPEEDLRWYRLAKVPGLKNQLQQNFMPTDGRKYDLYQRLVAAGIKLYTDLRKDGELDYDSLAESLEYRRKRKRPSRRRADPVVDDGADVDGVDSSDSGDDGDDVDDVDDGGNGDDGDDQGPPPRRRKLVGWALPAELQVQLITTLDPSALWNLIMAAPEAYLSNDPRGINALRIEANHQRRLDHPARPPRAGRAGASPDDPNRNRPMSLLEWVGNRALHDARFRAANRTRIVRVIDTYVEAYQQAYPQDDPDAAPMALGSNPREDILYYFQGGNTGDMTPIGHAARSGQPHTVHLLIAHGEDVNEILQNRTALNAAMTAMGGNISVQNEVRLQCVFALIGAGANFTTFGLTINQADLMLTSLLSTPGWSNAGFEFPRIHNPLGLTVRQFIADERGSLFDRTLLAMYCIYYRHEDYPSFI